MIFIGALACGVVSAYGLETLFTILKNPLLEKNRLIRLLVR